MRAHCKLADLAPIAEVGAQPDPDMILERVSLGIQTETLSDVVSFCLLMSCILDLMVVCISTAVVALVRNQRELRSEGMSTTTMPMMK